MNDRLNLQNDLDQLFRWSKLWRMDFNADKCGIISITRSNYPVHFTYSMNGTFKDLGVVDKTLSFTSHIDSIITKSTRVCGMIKRSIGFNAPTSVKLQLYKSLCRSILDFSCVVWSGLVPSM